MQIFRPALFECANKARDVYTSLEVERRYHTCEKDEKRERERLSFRLRESLKLIDNKDNFLAQQTSGKVSAKQRQMLGEHKKVEYALYGSDSHSESEMKCDCP